MWGIGEFGLNKWISRNSPEYKLHKYIQIIHNKITYVINDNFIIAYADDLNEPVANLCTSSPEVTLSTERLFCFPARVLCL